MAKPNPGHFGSPERPGGRPKGIPNKLTRSAREAFQYAFDKIGGAEALAKWAMAEPTEFMKLYARLIPTEVTGPDGGGLVVQIVKLSEAKKAELPE